MWLILKKQILISEKKTLSEKLNELTVFSQESLFFYLRFEYPLP